MHVDVDDLRAIFDLLLGNRQSLIKLTGQYQFRKFWRPRHIGALTDVDKIGGGCLGCTCGRRGRCARIPRNCQHFKTTQAQHCVFYSRNMAQEAEFFSFGTNDLTQMSFGFSRDDIGGFLPDYLNMNFP